MINAKIINKDPILVRTQVDTFFGSIWQTVKITAIFMTRVIFVVTIYYVYFN
jgi:hypothetical protein